MKKTMAILALAGTIACSSDEPVVPMPPATPETPAPLPEVSTAEFSNPTQITNLYYGPPAGKIYLYQAGEVGAEPEEEITIERLLETKEVMGITCMVQKDVVTQDEIIIEDTDDWLAQDDEGNLWYMGELARNYQDDGTFIDNEGSWEAGVDQALPGYWLPGNPQPNESYMQEYLEDEAEDYAMVEGFQTITIDLGTYEDCLVTRDINPFEEGVYELKYYAPGVGLIKEEKFEEGELVEEAQLVEIIE